MRENIIHEKLKKGELIVGMGIFTGDPVLIQMIGFCGYDFVFIDCEHTTTAIDTNLQSLIITANSVGMGTIVRVKINDEVMIRQAIEYGADGVVVPHCRNAEEARRMVQAAKFPPLGVRGSATDCRSAGYNCYPDFNFKEYVRKSNEETLIIPMAEDPEFFDNIDEILAVDGISAFLLGPSDLSLGLGIFETYNMENPEIKNRFQMLFQKAKEKGIPLMSPIAPPTLDKAKSMVENGVRIMTLRNDVTNFRLAIQGLKKNVYDPLKTEFENKSAEM